MLDPQRGRVSPIQGFNRISHNPPPFWKTAAVDGQHRQTADNVDERLASIGEIVTYDNPNDLYRYISREADTVLLHCSNSMPRRK
ncbi:hypothetical protein BDR05DRAFT_967786 [Suillus weaverae]|nr:hypothetical protein BDR05DRAFT_967786 [Suillus weaverae]